MLAIDNAQHLLTNRFKHKQGVQIVQAVYLPGI